MVILTLFGVSPSAYECWWSDATSGNQPIWNPMTINYHLKITIIYCRKLIRAAVVKLQLCFGCIQTHICCRSRWTLEKKNISIIFNWFFGWAHLKSNLWLHNCVKPQRLKGINTFQGATDQLKQDICTTIHDHIHIIY